MNHTFNKRKKFIWIPIAILGFIALGAGVVMLLWNAILPDLIAGVGQLSYFKAMGLLILCKILFGGFKGRPGFNHTMGNGFRLKEKMMHMTDEEKEKFKAELKQRWSKHTHNCTLL